MNTTVNAVTHDVRDICRRVQTDALAFVRDEEQQYDRQIEQTAQVLAATNGCQTVWMCGPSSVGKTTTAKRLSAAIEARGVSSFVISLDDFYRGRGQAPLLADGSYDYESPEAIDLEQLQACIRELLAHGETRLPQYDFTAGCPADTKRLLRVEDRAVVIIEGIQAFTPAVTATARDAAVPPLKLFINTAHRFADGAEVLLSRREIRLARRLLRDERTRDSDFERTMQMWQQVIRGDELYIFPYSDSADLVIDTTLDYEPCVLREPLLTRLPTLDGTAFEAIAARLQAAFERFPILSPRVIPKNSVLCEFLGG